MAAAAALGNDDDREQVKKQQGQVGGFREECSEDGDDGKLDRSDAESGRLAKRKGRARGGTVKIEARER
ncbi:hypothetical protein L5515_007104 [Caenorhabditis briggsae]|uniref:Uncharacterized protein n=1 Tax=Caenorhabditis briggsae TaxID=6238 RepID=A0AAE9JKB9_CAEBR|nr:hypothetical protein L5515_007104 [Caenorhabditis briggsae]